ncbi:hypothetical protein ABVT39_023275 [Epinephelus coioides]
MDPAESEPIKAALARQGLRLGQHEHMFQGIMETLQNLSAQVTNLTEQLRLSDHHATPGHPSVSTAPSPSPAPVSLHPSPHKEPYVPAPEPYAAHATPSNSPVEPMQLGRTRLHPSERQRRVNLRLCIYCGQAGHFLASCPQTPKEQTHQ